MRSSLTSTKNYDLFFRSRENRPVHIDKHKNLRKSMDKYGWIPAYPMHVVRDAAGRLVIVDGQHRFEIAKELGLAVWYVVGDESVDVAVINNGQKPWKIPDYVGSFQQRGIADYVKLQAFVEKHKIPLSTAIALLSGTVSYGNVKDAFTQGRFKIIDEAYATRACFIVNAIRKYNRRSVSSNLIDAIAACCRVDYFDVDRLVNGIERCPEKIVSYSTRAAMLAMLEEIYNFGRAMKNHKPLKIDAEKAMANRNAAKK
jgi:hypothetical protein